MNREATSRNIFAVVAQVIVGGGVLFVLYRYLYFQLGVEQIGVWSLVTSIASVTRIGDLGLSAGVVKYVAQALGRRDTRRAADVVQTAVLTLGVLMGALLVVGYPVFTLALGYLLPTQSLPIALRILPYALISLWVMVMVSVFSGGLDGCLRMDYRGTAMALSYVVYLGLALVLVPRHGLEGVVIAQLTQAVGLMIVMWWILKRQLKDLPLLPCHWKLATLKEMFGYGVSFQIISILGVLLDPAVKALMGKFGGLGAVGYYGMANTFVLQGRAVIVEGSRVIVPSIATLQEQEDGSTKSRELFITSYRLTFYVSALFYGLLGVSITSVSMVWLGHYETMFIQFALLLVVGWFVNTLIGPAYFSNLGTGKLRDNVISQVILFTGTCIVGGGLGSYFGGVGVVVGLITGLFGGAMFLLVSYTNKADLFWLRFVIPEEMTALLISAVVATVVSNFGGRLHPSIVGELGVALLCSVPLLLLGWFNPARMTLLSRGEHEA